MRLNGVRAFSRLVRARRRELRMSQAELAARAGVSRKWVSEFELGPGSADLERTLRVLGALGIDLSSSTSRPSAPEGLDLLALVDEHRGG